MELIRFIFEGWGHFFGAVLLIGMATRFIYKVINRLLKHYTIKKNGYPPPHCDAEGDLIFRRMQYHIDKINNPNNSRQIN